MTSKDNPLRRLTVARRNDEGMALVLAVLIVAILTISVTATLELVASTQTTSARARQAAAAFSAAEAGLDLGANQVVATETGSAQANGTTLTGAQTVDGNPVSWSASKAGDGSTWTVNVTATSPNGKVVRTLQEQLEPQTVTTAGSPSAVYGYGFFMADPTADCTTGTGDTIGNSSLVTEPVFIASSLCISGGGGPLIANPSGGSPITVYIGGKFQTQGNSSPIGTSSNLLSSATIVGGCQISFHGWQTVPCDQQGIPTNGDGSGVWASSYSSTPMALTKPTVSSSDADSVYQTASPGPASPCGAGSSQGAYLKFDTNSSRDTSVGTVDLLKISGGSSGNDYDCRTHDSHGNLVGQLTYVYGTPGSLTVDGTVFIDGNLSFSGNDQAVYHGTGTIYVDGTVSFSNGARLCGSSLVSGQCSGTWDPTQNDLEIVAVNHQNVTPGWSMGGDAQFEGIAYTNGRFVSGNSAWIGGPVIADSGQLSGDTKFHQVGDPPAGAPGAGTPASATTWTVKPGSWRLCPSSTGCS
jgi:Tfp pilus assembly protein PilX